MTSLLSFHPRFSFQLFLRRKLVLRDVLHDCSINKLYSLRNTGEKGEKSIQYGDIRHRATSSSCSLCGGKTGQGTAALLLPVSLSGFASPFDAASPSEREVPSAPRAQGNRRPSRSCKPSTETELRVFGRNEAGYVSVHIALLPYLDLHRLPYLSLSKIYVYIRNTVVSICVFVCKEGERKKGGEEEGEGELGVRKCESECVCF